MCSHHISSLQLLLNLSFLPPPDCETLDGRDSVFLSPNHLPRPPHCLPLCGGSGHTCIKRRETELYQEEYMTREHHTHLRTGPTIHTLGDPFHQPGPSCRGRLQWTLCVPPRSPVQTLAPSGWKGWVLLAPSWVVLAIALAERGPLTQGHAPYLGNTYGLG